MTVQLQGIGHVNAIKAKDIKVGDILLWNFGYTSKVLEVNFSKTGKTLVIRTLNEENKEFTRKLGANRLVGIK